MNRLIVAATIGNVFEWFDFRSSMASSPSRCASVLSDRRPDRITARHIRRLRPRLYRAAVGCDRRRWLYRPRRPQGWPPAVDGADDDRHDVDGGDAGLRDDWPCSADHHHARAALTGIFGRRRVLRAPSRSWPNMAAGAAGFSASWQFATGGIITALASIFGVTLTTLLDHQQLVDWGWRIPYFFGMLIGPAGLYVRSQVVVHAGIHRSREARDDSRSKTCCGGIRCRCCWRSAYRSSRTAPFNLMLYIPTFGVKQLHLPEYNRLCRTLVGGLILAIGCPLAGHWSDKTSAPADYGDHVRAVRADHPTPAFYLMVAWPSLAACIVAVAWLRGSRPATAAFCRRCCPSNSRWETRAIGVSLGFSTAVTIFGGFAPFVATWLIAQTGKPAVTELLPDIQPRCSASAR